ncbi:MAG: DUF2147 domain-containing protein [Verrucomicrobia bacterium]|nr:DUF2147 domain-containing protein [Verrucomicrobiota bacterium]
MNRFISVLLGILALASQSASADDGREILGVWTTTDNKSQVELFKVDDKLHGKIISLKEPNWPANDEKGMGGKPKNDRNNPDPKLRDQPIIGLEFMSGFTYSGKKRWESGKIYDPENGKTYKCKLSLVSTNRLDVRGFIGISLIGRTEVWTR